MHHSQVPSPQTSEADRARFFDASPNPYLVLDRQLHIAAANRAYLEATGRKLDDIVGRWAWEAFPTDPETERQAVASFERVIATKEPDTMALLRFDIPRAEEKGGGFEERYWSLIHAPVLGDDGEVAFVVQHALDVTELERLREEVRRDSDRATRLKPEHAGIFDRANSVHQANLLLKAESERLRALFQKAPGFICILSGPDLVFEFVNDAYERLFGARGFIGRTAREVFPDLVGQPFFDLLERTYTTGERFTAHRIPISLENVSGAGPSEHFLNFIYEPVRDASGAVTGLFIEGYDVTEQVRAEAALRASEERFRLMADAVPQIVWITDADGHVEFFNRQWSDYTGVPYEPTNAAEVAANHLHPDDAEATVAAFDEARRTGHTYSVEHRIRSKSGHYRWFLVRGEPHRDHRTGRVSGWFGASVDIHDRRTAEERLRESEERNRRIVEGVKDYSVFTTDLDGNIVIWTPGAETVFGWSAAGITGRSADILFTPEDRAAGVPARELAEAREKGCANDERWHIRKDGSRFFANGSVRPLHGADGEVAGFIKIARDETERRAGEAALQAESHRLQTLNRTGAALAAELDLERVVQLVTDAGVELTGAQFGAFFYNVLSENGESFMLYTLSGADRAAFERFGMPRATAVFQPTFKGEGVIRSDDILADQRYGLSGPHNGMPKGHLPVRSYLAVPVTSRSGEVIGGLFFGHEAPGVFSDDIEATVLGIAAQAAIAVDNARLYQAAQREIERRNAAEAELRDLNATLESRVVDALARREHIEEQLRQSQKMEAIGQLTGGVAHDFNNLLTVIRSSADLLRRRELSEEKRRRYVDAISDTADRAAKLTGQLLAFARRQALKPEVFDAAERVEEVSDMLRTVLGARVSLEVEVECATCLVEADPGQFETALVNMAVNARDAMNEEGRLTVVIGEAREMPAVRGHAGASGNFVTVAVSDTGTGIAPQDVARIFEPFFTTKEVGKGTGLGLSQVYGFAKQSGGEVTVASAPGEGTTFTLYLPRTEQTPAPVQAPVSEAVQPGRGRVLVVEDNAAVGEFAAQLLEDLGYEPDLAGNAAEALRLLGAERGRFDAVFSDVVMPGMSGVEFGQIVRERWPGLPVVLTSGYSHALVQDTRHGFPLLRKPYSVEELSKVLLGVVKIGRGSSRAN